MRADENGHLRLSMIVTVHQAEKTLQKSVNEIFVSGPSGPKLRENCSFYCDRIEGIIAVALGQAAV
jgi:hypothetical protein